jgi:hypothetical protein
MADEVPGDPKIKPTGHQGDFFHELDVNLEPGQHFFAARDPLWLSEGLVSRPVDGGIRWDAPAGGSLRFGIESGANLARLEVNPDGDVLIVAAGLALVWTGDVQLGAPGPPGLPGLTQVSGTGQIWLLVPGYASVWPHKVLSSNRFPILADPARLVWVRPGATPLTAAPGPGGRAWARIDGTATAVLHTWERPPATGGR